MITFVIEGNHNLFINLQIEPSSFEVKKRLAIMMTEDVKLEILAFQIVPGPLWSVSKRFMA